MVLRGCQGADCVKQCIDPNDRPAHSTAQGCAASKATDGGGVDQLGRNASGTIEHEGVTVNPAQAGHAKTPPALRSAMLASIAFAGLVCVGVGYIVLRGRCASKERMPLLAKTGAYELLVADDDAPPGPPTAKPTGLESSMLC